MKRFVNTLFFILFVVTLNGHPWKPAHYVIIDTDAGIDDIRAVSMMLASPNVRVMAIIASGGALDADKAYIKIRSLLNTYHHYGVPVGINRSVEGSNLPLPESMVWGNEEGIIPPGTDNFMEIITNALSWDTGKIKFVSLASLNTINSYIKSYPESLDRIETVIWSNSSIDNEGFNLELDKKAASSVMRSGVKIDVVAPQDGYNLYDDSFQAVLEGINTRYARLISSIFSGNSKAGEHPFARRATDDIVPVFIHYPSLFAVETSGNISLYRQVSNEKIKDAVATILKRETVKKNQMVKTIPTDTSFYMADIQPFMADIIRDHGLEEWSSGVLANELHRHLGIFDIIGVKMGILAREYFNIGVDEMKVVSSAGSIPPLSCMNDGLQVSTGATAGHGLIDVINENCSPSATFTFHNITIRISLKKDIADKIFAELKDLNYVYGLDSNIYWELVRQRSLLYWKNLGRYDVFEVTEVK